MQGIIHACHTGQALAYSILLAAHRSGPSAHIFMYTAHTGQALIYINSLQPTRAKL